MQYSEQYDKQAQGIPSNAYYYDKQLRNYILQFMAIFAGLQVSVGRRKTGETTPVTDCNGNVVDNVDVYEEERLISVPIHYGAQDRVVASILADNTQNKLLRLPMTSAYFRSIQFAPEFASGLGTQSRKSYVPTGGLVPDDIKVVHQRKPTPYKIEIELALYASNSDQHFQMLEQILMLFDPSLQIQTSDGVFDQGKLTVVTLNNTNFDQVYPSGTDRRIIQSTLTFEMPIYLSAPADIRSDFVEKIYTRIGVVSEIANNSYDIIAELDAQGIDYRLLFDGSAITI